MPNVVAIIHDDRVRRQTEQYLQELGMENLRFATFKNHQEFAALYFRVKPPPPEPVLDADGKPVEAPVEVEMDHRLFREVHLLIFALDSIGEKSAPFIERVKTNFKRFKFWPQHSTLRMIMLKYEDDGISKLDLLHPLLDDLIYLPLDRLVCLQKLEILLNLPKRVRPRFLFNQEVKQEIEISKITKIDRLSDVGLAIRNPIPLRKGLPGHFYVNIPGEKNRLEIRAKVFRSEPHPEFPGQYLVYFTYFGLPKNDLSTIRRLLSKAPRYQSLLSDDRANFHFSSEDMFSNETDTRTFGIAVIDADLQLASNMASSLGKDMDRLKVIAENSYSYFLHKYFEGADGGKKSPPKATEFASLYGGGGITMTISDDGLKCMNVEPAPNDIDTFLGFPAKEIFSTPEKWLTLFAERASKLVLAEAVQFATRGYSIEKLLILQDRDNTRCALNFKLEKGTADHLVTVYVNPASLSDIVTKINEDVSKDLDALILDTAFVGTEDTQAWIEGLRQRAVQVGLTKGSENLRFFFVCENLPRAHKAWLNIPDVLGLFVKPVDNRQLLFLLSEYLPNKNTVYQFENLGWAQPNLPVHVSKSVELEALSEFGATLKSKQPLAPGTMVYLRKSIYENAPNQCLAARIYSCEPHVSESNCFQVYATYFGINDQFLKFARTWIRENYATTKTKEA